MINIAIFYSELLQLLLVFVLKVCESDVFPFNIYECIGCIHFRIYISPKLYHEYKIINLRN